MSATHLAHDRVAISSQEQLASSCVFFTAQQLSEHPSIDSSRFGKLEARTMKTLVQDAETVSVEPEMG
jgi:hypothetical protein